MDEKIKGEEMKKPKVTNKTVKALHEALQLDYAAFRAKVRAYILANGSYSNRRQLMTINPVTEKGLVNAMSIAELILLVNLSNGTDENILLETSGNDLVVIAKRKPTRVPMELL
jgi:hypothetical protein